MGRPKVTSHKVARSASKVLRSKRTGTKSKVAAGSALSQAKTPKKVTSKRAASAASAVLRDGRTGKAAKSAAGSTLAQRQRKKKN